MEQEQKCYVDYLKQCEGASHDKVSELAKNLAFREKVSGVKFSSEALEVILDNQNLNADIRFGAWYTLFVSKRRNKSATRKLAKLVNDFKEEFAQRILFKVAAATVLVRQKEYKKAVYLAEEILSEEPDNLGFNATVVDFSLQWASATELDEPIGNGFLVRTHRLIQYLLEENPKYAKYHYFYSQYLLIEQQLEEAERQILLAIDIENEESSDYLLRISDYQAHYLKIRAAFLEADMNKEMAVLADAHQKLKQSQSDFHEQMDTMKAELKENQRQSFQLITVFIAVISILLSSLKGFSFSDTQSLIEFMMVMALSLLLFFSVLFGLISANKARYQILFVLLGVVSSSLFMYLVTK